VLDCPRSSSTAKIDASTILPIDHVHLVIFMSTWRERLATRLGPPIELCGITWDDWQNLLRTNDFDIDSSYSLRAMSTTFSSIFNSIYRWKENRTYGPKVTDVKIKPPLFILGHWRTGTTYLHNLLTIDDRFAFPNYYQAAYPHHFLCTESLSSKLGAFLLPKQRPMDNLRISFQAPNEDEFALCGMTLCSPYVGFSFPRRQDYYDQFLTLRRVAPNIVARWKAALILFLKKLTWKYDRPLVLKSPAHTCRIGLLRDLFPDARFIHIHRNPYVIYQSTLHWLQTAGPWYRLQRPDSIDSEARILRICKEMYEVFFDERALIPVGRFCEIGFEELEADPIGQMRKIYEGLELPDFGHVEPLLRSYLLAIAGYKKNELHELPLGLRERVAQEWERYFEEWGYAV
jgi:omega-hydroxy-beta-dihydromenaquinone-9 sulfotransferase